MTQFQDRTNQKLDYAKIHLEELENYSNSMSNDVWENAHQESCFYHLTSSVESILHEINDGYSLGLDLQQVTWGNVKKRINSSNQSSPALDKLLLLKNDSQSWLSQLIEWRNHGTHRKRVGKMIQASTWQKLDNEFKDPRTDKIQNIYPNKGCLDVLRLLTNDVENLIFYCRNIDSKL